jgi:hypothetical protein
MPIGIAKWETIYGTQSFILPSYQKSFGIDIVVALAYSNAVKITNHFIIWREIHQGEKGLISNDDFKGVISIIQKWLHVSDDKKIQ